MARSLQTQAVMPTPLQTYLVDLHASLKGLDDGAVATYIPELAKVDPNEFGICLVTMDGVAYGVGDVDALFTIQSISKAVRVRDGARPTAVANSSRRKSASSPAAMPSTASVSIPKPVRRSIR